MDNLDNLTYAGICNYFHVLSVFGYKSYEEVNKLIVALFIEDILEGPFSIYIDEDDYKTIVNVLYCLFGSSCVIPYPKLTTGISLIQPLTASSPRISEDNIIRFSENEFIRLVNK